MRDPTAVLFIDFDAGNWLERSVDNGDRGNAKPLHALGMSVTRSDGQQHLLIRLSFDDWPGLLLQSRRVRST